MRTFFQVLWFFAPVLLIAVCAFVALFALIQFRLGHWTLN